MSLREERKGGGERVSSGSRAEEMTGRGRESSKTHATKNSFPVADL